MREQRGAVRHLSVLIYQLCVLYITTVRPASACVQLALLGALNHQPVLKLHCVVQHMIIVAIVKLSTQEQLGVIQRIRV